MRVYGGQTGGFVMSLLATAVSMAVLVRVCHQAAVADVEAAGLIAVAAILLVALTGPLPIALLIVARSGSLLRTASFWLWIVLVWALGIWAALSQA